MDSELNGISANRHHIIQAHIDAGREVPESLINAPQRDASNSFYIDAFRDLLSTGQVGQISWIDTKAYADAVGVKDFQSFLFLMRGLEMHLLKHFEAQNRRNQSDNKNNRGRT